jgi:predicted 3-demethylubiquinone-9 3-methyltransferase (glyoxalase superfamily)
MQAIKPCLWFDKQAEEAAKLYCPIFKNAKLGAVTRYGKEGHEIHGMPEGSVLAIEFSLDGNDFVALNGGPLFKFTEAVSFQVLCETQKDVDYYWEKLSAGGDPKAQQCGWLKDKFGLSWQVVPTVLAGLLYDQDPKKAGRTMNALLQMKKLDIAALQRAHAG